MPDTDGQVQFCRSCGNSLEGEARFCPNCGTPAANDVNSRPDTHESPAKNPVGRKRPNAIVVGVIVLSLVAAFIVADWYLRNREMNNLLNAVEASEQAMYQAKASIRVVQLDVPENPLESELELVRAELRQASADGAADVLATGDEVETVRVLPWHTAIQEAAQRYLAHSDAWYDHLSAGALDEAKVFESDGSIDGTFTSAETAFGRAVPPLPMFDLEDRITDVFAE